MRVKGSVTLIVLLACALLAACSGDKQAGNAARVSTNAPPPASANTQPDNVRRVTISELRDMMDQDKAVVVDVRGDSSYNMEHIKGALDIPEAQLVARAAEFPKEKLIVLYCS